MNREKYLEQRPSGGARRGEIRDHAHRKRVWVVDRDHPRLTSSVVVTLVQVIHNDTS